MWDHRSVDVKTGKLDATGMRFGIVVGRFNDVVSQRLLEGAVDSLLRHGARDADLVVAWVPGSFEIPIAARELAEHGNVDAVICLGVVIRGETSHYDLVAGEAARGVGAVHAATGVPATFGVVTAESLAQALDRAGGKAGNKGADAAMAAVEMVSLLRASGAPGRLAGAPPPELPGGLGLGAHAAGADLRLDQAAGAEDVHRLEVGHEASPSCAAWNGSRCCPTSGPFRRRRSAETWCCDLPGKRSSADTDGTAY